MLFSEVVLNSGDRVGSGNNQTSNSVVRRHYFYQLDFLNSKHGHN